MYDKIHVKTHAHAGHNSHARSSKGFSLIELLFVLAIIAAIAVMGLAAYKQKIMNEKISKAALQMQMWLQAAMAYYVQEGKDEWPTTITELMNGHYIPSNSTAQYNPWGAQSIPETDYRFPSNKDSKYFIVETTIPTYLDHAKEIAQMIAARLPTGSVKPDANTTVQAMVPIPGISSVNNSNIIKQVKVVQSGTEIPKPTCPATWTANISVSVASFYPSQLNPGNAQDPMPGLLANIASCSNNSFIISNKENGNSHYICNDVNNNANYWVPTIKVWDVNTKAEYPGSGQLLVITSCQNPNAAKSIGRSAKNEKGRVASYRF